MQRQLGKLPEVRLAGGGLMVLVLAVVLAGCSGGSAASSANSSGTTAHTAFSNAQHSYASAGTAANTSTSSSTSQPVSSGGASPYLVKSLNVAMATNDPRKTAADLQQWIAAADPHASSAGMSYSQMSPHLYSVSLTFDVEAALYPQIEMYLASYPEQHGGQLQNLQESVQDVSNDYIDTQSRITNLKNELQRLQTIMGQAKSVTDILNVEQQISSVEGQLEQLEAHLNALSGQTTFYPVTITIAPLQTVQAQQGPKPGPFTPGKTLHTALAAALVVAQALATAGIWLGVFSVFVLPIVVVVLTVPALRRRVLRRRVPVSV